MIESPHDIITPFDGETPRRDAVRTMGVAGAALLGMAGLGASAEAKGKNRSTEAEKKRKRWVVNVFCTEATNTELRVGVICFSRNSFQLQG